VDLGADLGAMDPSAEHGFKTHDQVFLAEAAFISSSSLSGSSSPQPAQSLESTNLTLESIHLREQGIISSLIIFTH
jgi:hypothetical protein